jgi:uncharacterized Zn finger protein (UPF0148 family)
MASDKTKYCTKCKNVLFLFDFYKGSPWCISCRKEYNKNNKEKIKTYYQNKNTSEIQKRFYNKNKEKFFNYKKQRRKIDPVFKLIENTRHRIYQYLSKNKLDKSIEYLGCDLPSYKKYLESQFTSKMTWDNYGEYWEIDHIIPLFTFDFSINENMFKAFNYLNTRPLSKLENQKRFKKIKI